MFDTNWPLIKVPNSFSRKPKWSTKAEIEKRTQNHQQTNWKVYVRIVLKLLNIEKNE